MPPKYGLTAGRFTLALGAKTLVMGIVNLTPDSFSKDGRLRVSHDPAAHARFAGKLVREGADIIDIGGQSSRPGAPRISAPEELKRILPFLRLFVPACQIPVSVDTFKPQVAAAALDAGASIINNIMGTAPNKRLLLMARNYGAAIVLMHMRGSPCTMQSKTQYKDVVKDIIRELRASIEFCLEIGIKKDRIIIDPGIGFAKTAQQNLEILNRLEELKLLCLPVLVGPSRKSFIGQVLNANIDHRAWGTAASIAVAITRGADIVRAHDVRAMKQVAMMTDAIVHNLGAHL